MPNLTTKEWIAQIGTTAETHPSSKINVDQAKLQAVQNLTDVLKGIALVLIEIRDKQS